MESILTILKDQGPALVLLAVVVYILLKGEFILRYPARHATANSAPLGVKGIPAPRRREVRARRFTIRNPSGG